MSKHRLEIPILYEDRDIIVIYKPYHLLTIRTDDKKTFTYNAYHFLKERQLTRHEGLFIVHRLDFDTSGILVFAKSAAVKERLQSIFEARQVKRYYEAVIKEKIPLGKEYLVKQYLAMNKSHQVYVTKDKTLGKEAITSIKANNYINIGTALDIEIFTGRRNQIRIAISSLKLTLIGDKKYSDDVAKRMYLNAYKLVFPEEAKLKKTTFEVKPLWLVKTPLLHQ